MLEYNLRHSFQLIALINNNQTKIKFTCSVTIVVITEYIICLSHSYILYKAYSIVISIASDTFLNQLLP